MFECVVNVSEGRRHDLIEELERAAGSSLRDLHADAVHNRSVFTLIDEVDALRGAVRALASATMARLDVRHHEGVHPRFGVLDVVPFVALDPSETEVAQSLRDDTAAWLATTFGLPVFLYGELAKGVTRTLPEIRRGAFSSLSPDFGPAIPHRELGASAVGVRGVLVAWNLWLRDVTLDQATAIAASIRSPHVRALAFSMGGLVQVSCNLIDPLTVRPSQVYDAVARQLGAGDIDRAELVGLAPRALLDVEDRARWDQLGLSAAATIESRLGDSAGLGSALDGAGSA